MLHKNCRYAIIPVLAGEARRQETAGPSWTESPRSGFITAVGPVASQFIDKIEEIMAITANIELRESNSGLDSWYNFKTKSQDQLAQAPEDFEDYIPQDETVIALYRLMVDHRGYKAKEAAEHVLRQLVGRPETK